METQIVKILKNRETKDKNNSPERKHVKIMKKTRKGCPLKLDFDAPSWTESQLTLFQICSECDRIGGQRPPELKPTGACGSKKTAGERFRNHVKNITTKVSTNVTNLLPKEGPPTGSFCAFWDPHPRMVSKASPDRLQGPKAC